MADDGGPVIVEAAANSRLGAVGRWAQNVGLVAVALAVMVVAWEGYKAIGQAWGGTWPGTSVDLPVSPDDLTMPHTWSIVSGLFEPVQRGSDETLAVFLLKAAAFTFVEAGLGFGIGVIVGLGLAVLMLRSPLLDRALVPWINISQTVPLIALAPIIVTWGRTTFLGDTVSVALIAAYLTFFPVAVNGLAGLKSPSNDTLELMRSYAAPWSKTLIALRLPSARPYLFPAFKLAATLSVVGAIVGEISAGVRGGLGRAILDYAGRYTTGPEKLYAAVLGAALLGLFVFGMANLAEQRLVKQGEDQPR